MTKNFPFAELEFIKNAAEVMIELRRVLKYSYAYAYYLPNGKEKELFDYG